MMLSIPGSDITYHACFVVYLPVILTVVMVMEVMMIIMIMLLLLMI